MHFNTKQHFRTYARSLGTFFGLIWQAARSQSGVPARLMCVWFCRRGKTSQSTRQNVCSEAQAPVGSGFARAK